MSYLDFGTVLGIFGIMISILFWLLPRESIIDFFKRYSIKDFLVNKNLRDNFTIAVIDDEIDSYPVDYIKKLGYSVNVYESVSFTMVNEITKNDLILLDVKGVVEEDLEEGGAKLIKIIKQNRPLLPVVAVSSGYFQAELNDYFKSSDRIMNKPLDKYKMQSLLNELKDEFFDINKICNTIEQSIKGLNLSNRKKSKINKIIIDFISNRFDEELFIKKLYEIAQNESNNIVKNSKILMDRIKHA